ncbi:helix-turn-helix domain-containing protein (plasmid) [Arsenicicoccus dermatophilus]|uniref:helix-turn-helix domain-containing protein n=1 Tax=Arsenicicoccus dermatophilus TaxID=1076331 RepID=UPI003891CE4A
MVRKIWEDPSHPQYGLGPHASPEAREGRARRDGYAPSTPRLPVLTPTGPDATAPTAAVALVGDVVDGPRRPPTRRPSGRVVTASRRVAWRHRAELAPLMGAGVLVAAVAADPTTTAAAAGIVATAAALGSQLAPERVAGRVWLSGRERATAAAGATGAAAWATGAAAGWWHLDPAGLGALATLTGAQTYSWVAGRRPRRAPTPPASRPAPEPVEAVEAVEVSPAAAALVQAWPLTIGVQGPTALLGSAIDPATVREPHPGTIAMQVRLGPGVHAETATGDDLRRYLERALPGLGHGMVRLDTIRDDVSRVLVTITAGRHLETVAAEWTGPDLGEDGTIDLAVTPAGESVRTALHNADGVEHFAIFGTTGGGKSVTLVAMLLPGVMARREVVWYIDGGAGTSAAHLARACDWWAVEGIEEWCAVIRAAHAVMRARKDSRARVGLSRWRGPQEKDPILSVVFDEATTVLRALEGAKKKIEIEMVLELGREGRKLGVRVGQSTQDPMGDDLIGGRKMRGLMAGGGSLVGHRPGDGTANTLTGSSSAASVDLRALPPEAGWCAIIRRGKVLAPACRVRYADDQKVTALLAEHTPRGLDGADAVAAGPAYPTRVTGVAAAEQMAAALAAYDADDAPPVEVDAPPVEVDAPTVEVDTSPDAPPVEVDVSAGSLDGLDALAARLDAAAADAADVVGDELASRRLSGSQAAAAEQATTRKIAIMDALYRADRPLSTPEIVDAVELPRSTVRRLLAEITDTGLIIRDTHTGAYTLSQTARGAA